MSVGEYDVRAALGVQHLQATTRNMPSIEQMREQARERDIRDAESQRRANEETP